MTEEIKPQYVADVEPPPISFWAVLAKIEGRQTLAWSTQGPRSDAYRAYIQKSVYDELIENQFKLNGALATKDEIIAGLRADLAEMRDKGESLCCQNGKLLLENAALNRAIDWCKKGMATLMLTDPIGFNEALAEIERISKRL